MLYLMFVIKGKHLTVHVDYEKRDIIVKFPDNITNLFEITSRIQHVYAWECMRQGKKLTQDERGHILQDTVKKVEDQYLML